MDAKRETVSYPKENTIQRSGQGLVEYAMILVLVAVIVMAILTLLGPQVGNVFSRVMAGLDVNGSGGSSGGPGGGSPSDPSATVTSVNAFRTIGGPDVLVTISVSANTTVTVTDSQSGQSVSVSCDGNCDTTLNNVGPGSGTVTVTAPGGSSLSASYPAS